MDSRRATAVVEDLLVSPTTSSDLNSNADHQGDPQRPLGCKNRIRARTARRWLAKMGFSYTGIKKGVYIDGHEREDVVDYRNKVFLPKWEKYFSQMVTFAEDGT